MTQNSTGTIRTAPTPDEELVALRRELRALTDHREISELVARLGRWLDGRCLGDADALFTPEAVAVTPGGTDEGRTSLVEQARQHHAHYHRLQHSMAHLLVEQDGDRASGQANLTAVFVENDPPAVRVLAGDYRFGFVRTADGWRFSRIEIRPTWMSTGSQVVLIPQPAGA
ncbi:nuclear transport factor 2 family protein [Micromonospora purpureochromogenes]|nr:nuclear transport factor 2 family protein [Micromonospora purpureochromogenes]